MTKKARTGKLYSEVEGEILMENAPDDMMTKENNENEEKMTEIEDIRASHDVDAIMTDDKEEEIIFEQELGTATSTESDSKDTSSSASSSASSTSVSDSKSDASSEVVCKSDASSEVVCTKVIQGEEYEKPDDWPSDDDEINKKLSATALMVPKDENEEDKHGKEEVEFINVMSKNNRKKQKKKQKKIDAIKAKADSMDRAHMLLRESAHESDYEDTEAEIEHDKKISKHKPGQTRDTAKLPPKSPKDNHNKEKKEAGRLAINSTEDLPMTINEYRIDMEKGTLRTIVLDPTNTLFAKYTKDKLKPKPYHKADRWDRPLAKVPGGRSFESDVNKFLRLIRNGGKSPGSGSSGWNVSLDSRRHLG
jgi:hypothetical protein